MTYDSTQDTLKHIDRVRLLLWNMTVLLDKRGIAHDASKLKSPEKEAFDAESDILHKLTYGSKEYEESVARLGPAQQHHFENNKHHPEHWPNGIEDMDLVDLIEMICDWKASSERNAGSTLNMEYNFEKYKFSPQLAQIFQNTKERYLDVV